MVEETEIRKQWHPVLIDGLIHLMGDRLKINHEYAAAALPTKIDILIVATDSPESLDAPYHLLSRTNLVELEGPGEYATWRSLVKVFLDANLYSLQENLDDMSGVGLWLVASHMSERFFERAEEEIGPLKEIGKGLWQGKYRRSPVYLVHLHELALSVAAIPLLMVYKGSREAEIAEFVLQHGQQDMFFSEQAITFHAKAVKEALEMKGMNVEAYRKLANVHDIVDLFGPRILLEEMGTETAIRTIGEKEFIRTIGQDEVIRSIGQDEVIRSIGQDEVIRILGEDQLRELLIQRVREREETLHNNETPSGT